MKISKLFILFILYASVTLSFAQDSKTNFKIDENELKPSSEKAKFFQDKILKKEFDEMYEKYLFNEIKKDLDSMNSC